MAYAEKVYKVRNGKPTKQFTWRARYKAPEGHVPAWPSEPGFPTKKLAEEWGEAQEAAIRGGRWIDPALSRTLFGTWAREWMASKSPRGHTVATRWNRLEHHILPRWEHTPISQITWFDAEQWANSMECDDSTATHCLTLMSQILTGAVDKQMILVNPMFGRRRSRPAEAKAARYNRNEAELWAPAEVVLQAARRGGPADGLHILTVAFTGVRWGESLALRPSSLTERVERTFSCPGLSVVEEIAEYQKRAPDGRKLGMVHGLEPLKTRQSQRLIDLPPFLVQLLETHVARGLRSPDFLFTTPRGQTWWRSNFANQVMRPVCDGRKALAAGRGHAAREAWKPLMPGLTMRALRHTHDTYQDQLGVRPTLAFEQAGHRRPGIKAVYQHPTPGMRRERLDGLQEIYEGAMKSLGWSEIWPQS
ncbi:hypothetical protein [Streptomyces sp. SCSIO ZS0520]|uniref:hypothetical protein n=1 Tax=Streptomyces sp. SCSIO ZS0520 TaxID=2892996 RepID=UPI0021D816CA|nr:hypothetical protein [Streptomyces sp. SCSIO ZS0520]